MCGQNPVVYIVDDDVTALRTLAKKAEGAGYNIKSFSSARDFLDNYSGQRGCLILDLCSNGVSGLEVQKQLISRAMSISIIFTTEPGRVAETVRAIKSGAFDCLEKPFRTEVLLERIEAAIERDFGIRSDLLTKRELQFRLLLLTDRERDIYKILEASEGFPTSKEIAKQLGISHRTVEHYRSRILEKTRTRSIAELLYLTRRADT